MNKTELTWKWMSYCSTATKPCREMSVQSPPSTMKVTSRCTTYPRMSMIQRWKRENISQWPKLPCGCISFCFLGNFWWWFMSNGCVSSNPIGKLVEACEKNTISKIQHDPTVDSKDMTTGALLVSPNSTLLSQSEFSLLSLILFIFLNRWPLCSFIGTFFPNYNFVPHLCLYVFYFIFHVNYLIYFCLNR